MNENFSEIPVILQDIDKNFIFYKYHIHFDYL